MSQSPFGESYELGNTNTSDATSSTGRHFWKTSPSVHVNGASSYSVLGQQTRDGDGVSKKSRSLQDPFLDDEPPGLADKVPPKRSNYLRDWWLWEIASCAASIGATIGIAAVLFVFDRHALPNWPLGITLNALVSLLAVTGKAAMLVVVASCIGQLKWHWFSRARSLKEFEIFDDASRGPVGAIQLMTATRPLHLVSLGAFITIIAIAVDPFVQQVIAYDAQPVLSQDTITSVGRAQIYDAGIVDTSASGSGLQEGPEFGMKAAIYNGLFASPGALTLIPNCATGNCSVPAFASLAVCSNCSNVTDNTVRTSYRQAGSDRVNILGDPRFNMTYAMPGGVQMNVTFDVIFDETPTQLSYGPAMISSTDMPGEMSASILGTANPIVSVAMLQFPQVNAEGYNGNYKDTTPLAWECALYFCLNTYTAEVVSGQPQTNLISSWKPPGGTLVAWATDGVLERPASEPNTSSTNSTYWIPSGTLLALSAYLNYTLTGQVLTDTSETPYNTFVNDVLQVLNLTEDIGSLFNNLSESMTTYIRTGVPANQDSLALGSASRTEIFVQVRWPWMILPVALVLLSTLFLVATMVATKLRGDLVWKSSSLATLFHGVEAEGRQPLRQLSQMDIAAKERSVALRQSQGKWILAHASKESLLQ